MAIDPHRSFESDIKKLQKLWDGGQENVINADSAQKIAFMKKQQLEQILKPALNTKVLPDIGGDYKDIITMMTDPYNVSGFLWTITKTLPEDWIPLVKINIGYNYNGQIGDFSNIITYLNKVVTLNPSSNGNGDVTVTWQIGMYLVSYDPTVIIPDFQAKLYFLLISPSNAT